MQVLELTQPVELSGLQSLQLVVGQVQVAQVGHGMEGAVMKLHDLVGAQDQLLEPADPLEGQPIHGGNVVVVQVEPDELVEMGKLVRQQTQQAVVAQGQALAPSRNVFWDVMEGTRLAVNNLPLAAAAERAYPLPLAKEQQNRNLEKETCQPPFPK